MAEETKKTPQTPEEIAREAQAQAMKAALEQAQALYGNVKKAIDELNTFVVGNDNFGKGISTSQDGRRCLCWLDGDGNFHEDKEAYEFI